MQPAARQLEIKRQVTEISAEFSGPIPPPGALAAFEKIHEGLADRIMRMAEGEAAHRRTMEAKIVDGQVQDAQANRRESLVGQIFGLIIGLAALGFGAYCVVKGHDWAGGIIGAGGVTGLVTVFIIGRKSDPQPTPEGQTQPEPSA